MKKDKTYKREHYDSEFIKVSTKLFKHVQKEYDMFDSNVKVKYDHTHRVIEYSEQIARAMGLDEENIYISKLVALFHDFGRFEQTKRQLLFKGSFLSHGELGAKVLFEENIDDKDRTTTLIEKFLYEPKYYGIIKEAISNHDKLKIAKKGLTKDELLHSKLIRDADKMDIYYIRSKESELHLINDRFGNIRTSKMSDAVYRSLSNRELAKKEDFDTGIDILMNTFCFVYDYNFDESLKILLEKGYLEDIRKNFNFTLPETQQRVNTISKMVDEYIEERISKIKEKPIEHKIENRPLKDKEKIIENLLSGIHMNRDGLTKEKELNEEKDKVEERE